jgi:uncharacterized protein YndB with AHSA1/START domain
MVSASASPRTDSASRLINASRQTIYRAFTNPDAWVKWLPPRGMTARLLRFDLREGGSYRMALTYCGDDPSVRGKTAKDTDVVDGRFLDVVQDARIVQLVKFESDDPAFAGEMKMTWTLSPAGSVTKVSIICENVPEGIRREEHDAALRSTLENLATLVER